MAGLSRPHDLRQHITTRWPTHERYGLISQARRAAVSAELNIAEGAAKRGAGDFARFLDMSQGSPGELECLLEVARDVGYVDRAQLYELENLRVVATRAVVNLYQVMRRAARANGRPLSSAAPIGRSSAAPA